MYSFSFFHYYLIFSPKLETKYIGFHIPKFVSVFVETFHQEQTSNNNILQNLHISEDYKYFFLPQIIANNDSR